MATNLIADRSKTDFDISVDHCVICGNILDGETVKISEKGVAGLQKASHLRTDHKHFYTGQTVHTSCRHQYCNNNTIKRDLKRQREEQGTEDQNKPALRSKHARFDIASDCIFCGQSVELKLLSKLKRGYTRKAAFHVRSFSAQHKIEQTCLQRGTDDSWAMTVLGRIKAVNDLHAADAVYHQQCSVNFRTLKGIPAAFRRPSDGESTTTTTTSKGKPVDTRLEEAFERIVSNVKENDDEQLTISDLCQQMREYLDGDTPYTDKYMRKKLQDHFGEELNITCIRGKRNVVTFRATADKILEQFAKSNREKDCEKEKLRTIKTAAKLILSDIKSVDTSKEEYPSTADISDVGRNFDYLPPSLAAFLGTLLERKKDPELKIASLGQTIMQAARPNVLIPPLQIGLGVAMHHLTGSKQVVQSLHKLGFSSSYNEVKLYEMCAAADQGTDLAGVDPNSVIQFVADNVDHQIRTLDGTGTFHGMGIIGAATPGTKQRKAVRRDVNVTSETMSVIGKVPIHYFNASAVDLSLAYEVLEDFAVDDKTKKLDLLWKVSWPLRSPRPGWSGMMQTVCDGRYPGQSSFTFLPMIDMDPTNMSCIYSTLHFVSSLASRYRCTPVLTFDQPLWWKSMMIVDCEPLSSSLRSIVLRLGGFHCEMSYLGSIGKLMAGSGLEQVLELVFAQNSVTHMLSGKSVSRAVRGHFLVDAVLNALVLAIAFDNAESVTEESDDEDQLSVFEAPACGDSPSVSREPGQDERSIALADENTGSTGVRSSLHSVLNLFDNVLDKTMSSEQFAEKANEDIEAVERTLLKTKTKLRERRTPCMWLQYMQMVDILRQFLKAERTGNWKLHLHALQRMLPFLAAAGHFHYTKSVHIYLQQMQQLRHHHPDVYDAFMNGYHVLRRSDRYWAGLSTDLVIEQVLMRSVKSAGGLTRGRGMADCQRAQWLLSMPACADMNNALQEVTGLTYCTSEQHVEAGENRKAKDEQDMKSILNFLLDRNPFGIDESLRNISTGVTAESTVNADRAEAVGKATLESMLGKPLKDFKFSRKAQAVTMDVKTAPKVDGEHIQVDPQLLFQRLVAAASAEDFDLSSIFKFELSTPPPSLFDKSGFLRDSSKSALADALLTTTKDEPPEEIADNEEEETVLDGGSLLHRIAWRKQESFSTIASSYAQYVCHCYSKPTVVFDGYEAGPSTKDTAHLRRSGGMKGPTVKFTGDMPLTSKKEVFLSNPGNKQAFINFLSEMLISRDVCVLHAKGDADKLIVETALRRAASHTTTVVGEDTDLLVLLLHHAKPTTKPIFFRSDKKTGTTKRVWNIQWLSKALGPETCLLLPFVHALNGCDTTSRLFGVGKGVPLKKLSDPCFKTQAYTFCKEATQEDVIDAGEKALVCLYGGRKEDSLDALRYQRFHQKVSSCATSVQIQSLPPTSSSAKYHSLRVYLQVQEWINPLASLAPELWGWKLVCGRLEPRQTDLPPAPEDLLKVIRCNCKTDCVSKRCNCRKHGLECSVACGQCKGLSCSNSITQLEEDDVD